VPNVPVAISIEHPCFFRRAGSGSFTEMVVGEVGYGAAAPSDGTESVRYDRRGSRNEAGVWTRRVSAHGRRIAPNPCATTADGAGERRDAGREGSVRDGQNEGVPDLAPEGYNWAASSFNSLRSPPTRCGSGGRSLGLRVILALRLARTTFYCCRYIGNEWS
jgi:hypothetical protein